MNESTKFTGREFRQALGTFATGVTVVTTTDSNGLPRGFTANSFTSVSLEPPLVLVCLASDAATCPVFTDSGFFNVNVLAENQQDVASIFASPGDDRFEKVSWSIGENGRPILDDTISRFECQTSEVYEAGDHFILLGRVTDYNFSSRSPLVYCSGSYVEFGLLQRAMEAASSGRLTRISAVVDCGGSILLAKNMASKTLALPSAPHVGVAEEDESLIGKLAGNGVEVETTFVCSVYEDTATKTNNIVYRGIATKVDKVAIHDYDLVALDDIPWDQLCDDPLRMLLTRYIEETEVDAFGVYVGDNVHGEVHKLRAGS